ncbi:MAG: DUF4197 domain-containing protein [Weeksellaceae bacterium]
MKKSIFIFCSLFFLGGCAELQQITTQLPGTMGQSEGMDGISAVQISNGLKQALELGVQDGIQNLGKKDGFFGNSLVKVLLPEELQAVDKTLRNIGMGSLADEGLKLLNRAAEDAVTEATPIFANAITGMSFNDAKGILFGGNNAATNYFQNRTSDQLFNAFKPKVQNSLGKVGADKIWTQIITQYNNFTGNNITTDLNNYVTQETINGVFKMVAQKENGIRNNLGMRTTPLLLEVFALQDRK